MPISVLLKCYDIETTKSFYAEILDFEVIDSSEGTCTVQKEDCSIIFTAEELWSGHPKCTGTIYLFIDDVDPEQNPLEDAPDHWVILSDREKLNVRGGGDGADEFGKG